MDLVFTCDIWIYHMSAPKAVAFDPLTALLDSWSIGDGAAGGEADGLTPLSAGRTMLFDRL